MSTQMQTCALCGGQVPVGSRFCQNCGHAMTEESSTARVESITPPQGSPTVNVGQQYTPGNTQYPPQAPTQSWQPAQQAEAPRQPQYAPPPTEPFAPPPANLYGQQPPTYQQTALQPSEQAYTPQPYSNAPLNPAPGQGFSLGGVSAGLGREPLVALLLELIGYIPSLPLGIGHMYAGRIGRGVALMLAWWVYGGTALFLLFTIVGAPIACLMFLLWPVIPLISGFWIKRDLDMERARLGTGTRI